MKTPYIVGPPVKQPSEFFGRAEQTRQFFDTLAGAQLQCVSVLGLRRAGKTSFLQHVSHPKVMGHYLPDANRYLMLYTDLSSCRSPSDFYTRIYTKLINALPRAAAGVDRSRITADVFMVESLLYEFGDRRIVFLMDEFDQLRAADFGDDFMTELRALAGVWDYELAYVTASYWDLYRLGKFVGLPPTSPFYNIFYPVPIYLSGLNPADLNDLIRIPASRVGITADDEDVAYIRHIAGTLPFFVQAMATVWLTNKAKGNTPDPREVTFRLVSEMGPFFEQWMRTFSDVERDVLRAIIQEKGLTRLPYDEAEIDTAVNHLLNYGVLTQTGEQIWCDSRLFHHWLHEFIGQEKRPTAGLPAPIPFQANGNALTKSTLPVDGSLGAHFVEMLDEAGKQLERHHSITPTPEDGELRDMLLATLRGEGTFPPGSIALVSTGKTDILARAEGTNFFVAECGRWRGQKALLRTVDLLLGCLTRRDTYAAAAIFARNKDLSLIINAIVQAMPHHSGYLGFKGYRSGSRLDYIFHINGDPHCEVNLSIILFRLPH